MRIINRDSKPAGGETENETEKEKDFLARLATRVPCLGVLLALATSFFLASAGLLVKLTRSIHGVEVAVFRAYIQLAIYLATVLARRLPFWPARGEWRPVMARATLSAASITCTHFAIKMIPLGDLTVIKFSLPIWTLIIGYLILREPCSLVKLGAVALSMLGVALIAKPDFCLYLFHLIWRGLGLESAEAFQLHFAAYWQLPLTSNLTDLNTTTTATTFEPALNMTDLNDDFETGSLVVEESSEQLHGSLLALASSLMLAFSIIALKLCRQTPTETIIFWLSLYSVIFGSGLLHFLGEWRLPQLWPDCLYIVLNGLCGAAGQWCFTSALKVEQPGVVSLVRTADIQVAFLYSWLLLHEHIRPTSIAGSLMVLLAVLAVMAPQWLEARKKRQAEPQV